MPSWLQVTSGSSGLVVALQRVGRRAVQLLEGELLHGRIGALP